MKPIAKVAIRRRLEWFRRTKRRHEPDNIRAVAEMKMEGKRPRGRCRLRRNDTVRRDINVWKNLTKEELTTDKEKWTFLCKSRYPAQGESFNM